MPRSAYHAELEALSVDNGTLTVYRPTGPRELELVAATGYRRWPGRLPEQPYFYPVATEVYAREIAQRWNVSSSGAGFVTRFQVKRSFLERYQPHQVGGREHVEWWIPAEDLDALNDNIVGVIEVVGEYA